MKNGFLLIRAKFLQKILLIKKLYVPVSMKINQSIGRRIMWWKQISEGSLIM